MLFPRDEEARQIKRFIEVAGRYKEREREDQGGAVIYSASSVFSHLGRSCLFLVVFNWGFLWQGLTGSSTSFQGMGEYWIQTDEEVGSLGRKKYASWALNFK